MYWLDHKISKKLDKVASVFPYKKMTIFDVEKYL
jgi:hypothetical protein